MTRSRLVRALATPALGSMLASAFLVACAHGAPPAGTPVAGSTDATDAAEADGRGAMTSDGEGAAARDRGGARASGGWLGARAVHDVVLASNGAADIGVWVDAPAARAGTRRPKVDVALAIDVSGSMSGSKFQHAREAALGIVKGLVDGDIVSVATFDTEAHRVLAPVTVDPHSRAAINAAIGRIQLGGNTNMFDGLELAESELSTAPSTHAVRRVVMISDGRANVGPSSPELLGGVAARGLATQTQVTSLGLGLDYDEHTLDALAVQSAGRMYHLTDAVDTASTLRDELALLTSSVASDAYLEVVPAPGVHIERVFGVGGWHGEATPSPGAGAERWSIPLGSLFAGQHREALVRVRFDGGEAVWRGAPRALASVRLHFRDLGDDSIDRVQETVARVRTSDDAGEVARSAQPEAEAIAATALAADDGMLAVQAADKGDFAAAADKLASVSTELSRKAASAPPAARARLTHMAAAYASGSAAARSASAPAAAPAMKRETVLKMNSSGMTQSGF